ncbi:hypothetical protein N7468_009077 [Penicillium chermesinum]|uniref:Uncharacterized protein n=1 Tax=Penicillium chermesinum TaxID=63820 RepID=A0A9W9TEN5_9EURO|nr:uncharacterized protein N7468_009077 [Penicillium chermesinum]KAJ5219873.1 hypothetical protein N7468_009077 [Penicillium chermesinum]
MTIVEILTAKPDKRDDNDVIVVKKYAPYKRARCFETPIASPLVSPGRYIDQRQYSQPKNLPNDLYSLMAPR